MNKIKKTYKYLKDIGIAKNAVNNASSMKGFSDALTGLTEAQARNILIQKKLSPATINTIINGTTLASSEAGAATATGGLSAAFDGLAVSLGISTTALIGITAGIAALAIAIPITIKLIDKYYVSEEELRKTQEKSIESLNEKTKALKEEEKVLSDNIAKYKEYKTVLSDSTSSIDEITSAKENLTEIQDSLMSQYGAEADGIDLVNGKYAEQIKKLEELQAKQEKQYINDKDNKKAYKDSVDYLNKSSDYGMTSVGLGTRKSALAYFGSYEEKQEGKELLKQYGLNFKETRDPNGALHQSVAFDESKTREEAYEVAEKLQEYIDNRGQELNKNTQDYVNRIINNIISDIDIDKISEAKAATSLYEQYAVGQSDYSDLYNRISSAKEKYEKDIEDGNLNVLDKDKQLINQLWEEFQTKGKNASNTIKNAFENIYDNINFNVMSDSLKSAERNLKKNKVLTKANGGFGLDGKTQDWLGTLSNSDLKIVAELDFTNDESLDDVIKRFENAKKAASELTEEVETYSDRIKNLSDISSQINSLSTSYQGAMENGFSSISDISGLDLAFQSLPSFEAFSDTVTSGTASVDEVQSAFNKLTTEYIAQKGILDDLTESNKDQITTQLKAVGITNAQEIVTSALEVKLEAQRIVTEKLGKTQEEFNALSYENQVALLNEANASDIVKGSIAKLQLTELQYNKQGLDVTSRINSLKNLAKAYGLTATAAKTTAMIQREAEWKSYEARTGANTGQKYTKADFNTSLDDAFAEYEAKFSTLANYTPEYTSSSSNSANSAKESANTVFDWIETRMSRLKDMIQKTVDQINSYTAISVKKMYTTKLIEYTKYTISEQTKAYKAYMAKANSVNLSSYWKNLVQNGAYDESTVGDSDLVDRINKYKDYYENALKYQDEITSLKEQETKYGLQLYDIEVERIQQRITKIDNNINKAQNKISSLEKQGKEITKADYDTVVRNIDTYVALLQGQNRIYKIEMSTLFASSEEYQTYLQKLYDNEDKITELIDTKTDTLKAISEIQINKVDALLKQVDDEQKTIDAARNYKSSKGENLSVSDYNVQINNLKKQAEKYMSEYYGYVRLRTKAMMAGNTTLAAEYATKQSEVWANNKDTLASIEEVKDALRDDVYWRDFEKAHTEAQALTDKLKEISSLINDEMVFDDNGTLTDVGVAKIGTIIKSYETAKKEIQNYSADIANLNKLYKNGEYTQDEYTEKLNELQNSLLSSTNDVKSYTDSLIDLYETQGNLELESLKEIISARTEALNKKKEYYDYNKTISSKNKDIQSIQAQIAATEAMEDSLEKRKKLVQLQDQLAEKQDDLEDTKLEHEISLVTDGLDNFMNDLEEAYNDQIDALKSSLEKQTEIINNANELYANSYSSIFNTLNSLLANYGVDTSKVDVESMIGKFATGGITKSINKSGEDGFVLARDGEGFVMPEDVPYIKNLLNSLPKVDNVLSTLTNIPDFSNINSKNDAVTINYDNLINIEGNANSETIIDLKKLVPQISEKVIKDLTRDLKKSGHK